MGFSVSRKAGCSLPALSVASAAAIAFCAVLAIALALGSPSQAYAAALQAGSGSQQDASRVAAASAGVKTQAAVESENVTWLIAGKKLYRWANYTKSVKNGSWLFDSTVSNPPYAGSADSKMKSSNPKVIAAKKSKYGFYTFAIKKAGKATITYETDYTGDGIKVKHADKHTVLKYSCPVSSFKVGSKNYAKNLKSRPVYNTKKALKGKVRVKAAKGWKVVKIRAYANKNRYNLTGEHAKSKTVKQGGNVSLAKGYGLLEAVCYNKTKKLYSDVILTANVNLDSINAGLG